MSKKEEQSEAYIKPTILYRNKNLNDNNWKLGLDYLDFTGYEVQCAFEAGWDAAIDKACEYLKREYEDIGIRYVRGCNVEEEIEELRKFLEE